MKEVIITLTDEQFEIVKDSLQEYAEILANDRIAQGKDRERSAMIKVLVAKTDEELAVAVKPFVDAAKAADAEAVKP